MIFTINQLKEAHAKVKSGADFPQYVQDLITIGVIKYEAFVKDGHTMYHGNDHFTIQSDAKYTDLIIADQSDIIKFQQELKAHQQGKTDYPTFCATCASTGVEKWVVNMIKMTCTYYDKAGNELLIETIPTP